MLCKMEDEGASYGAALKGIMHSCVIIFYPLKKILFCILRGSFFPFMCFFLPSLALLFSQTYLLSITFHSSLTHLPSLTYLLSPSFSLSPSSPSSPSSHPPSSLNIFSHPPTFSPHYPPIQLLSPYYTVL